VRDPILLVSRHSIYYLTEDFSTDVSMQTLSWRILKDIVKHFTVDTFTDQEELLCGVYGIVELHDVGVALAKKVLIACSLTVRQLTEQFYLTGYTFLNLLI
jgi:hypothetical protein